MSIIDRTDSTSEEEYKRRRDNMVEYQIANRGVKNPDVLAAMRSVPRHLFVPPGIRRQAYDDGPLPIGEGQTISQPYIVASMTEYLEPSKDKHVLEVGTGSGYQTAVLAEVFGEVTTAEYFPELSRQAKEVLDEIGYTNVNYYVGDALTVVDEGLAFDAIIVTAAPPRVPDKLTQMLKIGGRMVIPVGEAMQYLQLLIKKSEEGLDIKDLYAVRFVPLQAES